MSMNKVFSNKSLINGKYVVGIDPGDTAHKAIIISAEGFPISKPFGFSVDFKGFQKFENKILNEIPKEEHKNIVIGIESSCNLWQTFIDYFKDKYEIVKVSPLTTYLSRGKMSNNFSKTDNKDSYLVAAATQQGNFTICYKHEPIYQELHNLNIYFNKISNNKIQAKLRLRGLVRIIFPELLKCLKIDTLTCLYLLNNYMTPKDFLQMDIEKEAKSIKKISISQHGEKTLLKIKEFAKNSIGIKIESKYKSIRLILSSMIKTFQHFSEEISEIGTALIELSKDTPYFEIITSIKGVSDILASQLIAELGDIKQNFNHYKQIEAFSGYNLRISQSGKSSGAKHINKHANGRLGKVLYQIIRHTSRYIPEIKLKYLRRKLKKNIYKKNIIACIPQFLSMFFALIKGNHKYELKEEKYNELIAMEKKNNIKSKEHIYYEINNIEKSRFSRPGKMEKINN